MVVRSFNGLYNIKKANDRANKKAETNAADHQIDL